LEFIFDIQPRLAPGGKWVSNNEDSVDLPKSMTPWLFASAATQLEHFEAELLGPDDPKGAKYSVKLYFVDADVDAVKSLPIQWQNIAVDGTTSTLTVPDRKTVVILREFKGIEVNNKIVFDAKYDDKLPPLKMAAIEIIREESSEGTSATE
jgi:hypothetical protein